jgi:hypothetical protein
MNRLLRWWRLRGTETWQWIPPYRGLYGPGGGFWRRFR